MLRPLQHVLHCTIAMHWAAAEDMLDLLLQYDLHIPHTGIFPAAKGRQQLHLHWDYPANITESCLSCPCSTFCTELRCPHLQRSHMKGLLQNTFCTPPAPTARQSPTAQGGQLQWCSCCTAVPCG